MIAMLTPFACKLRSSPHEIATSRYSSVIRGVLQKLLFFTVTLSILFRSKGSLPDDALCIVQKFSKSANNKLYKYIKSIYPVM